MKTLLIIIFSLWILPLPAQNYWAGFSNLKFDGDYFYGVANNSFEIVKLNLDGTVVATFGKRGRGPQEFSSQSLDLVLDDTLVHVVDKRGLTFTTVRKDNFQYFNKINIDKAPYALTNSKDSIYGMVMDFETVNPFEDDAVQYQFREINNLKNPKTTLFTFKDVEPINPFYDEKNYVYNDKVIVIWMNGKHTFYLFNGSNIKAINIPFIEAKAVGEEIKRDTKVIETPEAKAFWKEKIMPSYTLIKGAAIDENMLYFQAHSYKEGDLLLGYNIEAKEFNKIGRLSSGNLIAVKDSIIYTIDNDTIKKESLTKIISSSNEQITFYLSSDFLKNNTCTTCSDSFYEWVDYFRNKNMPVRIVIEDDSWFGRKEVTHEIINYLSQKNIWGAVSYSNDCNDCFEKDLSVKIDLKNSESVKYNFPSPISIVEQIFEYEHEEEKTY